MLEVNSTTSCSLDDKKRLSNLIAEVKKQDDDYLKTLTDALNGYIEQKLTVKVRH